MPTDNKKISAYVPDVIYDRFIQFQEEHELSMSKAAIEIFAAYFGINLNPTISNETTSELQSRIENLEKELVDLKNSHIKLYEKVDLMFSASEPLINKPLEFAVDKDINSELESNLISELNKKEVVEQFTETAITNELESSLDSEPPKQLQLINSIDLLSELKGKPLQSNLLSTRLQKVSPQVLSIKKSDLLRTSPDKFYDWLQSKDIDHIRWVIIGEGHKARYIPVDDTPVHKLQALKEWLQTNT